MSLPQNKFRNIEELVHEFGTKKSVFKGNLRKTGFLEGVDYYCEKVSNWKHGGNNKVNVYLTEACYSQLRCQYIIHARKHLQIKGNIQVEYIKRYLPKETETLDFVHNVFSPIYTVHKQFPVMNKRYYIDLYIVELNLAIECDEFNHNKVSKIYEATRQSEIEKALSCTFLRFNPDSPDFTIANVITNIVQVVKSTSETNKGT